MNRTNEKAGRVSSTTGPRTANNGAGCARVHGDDSTGGHKRQSAPSGDVPAVLKGELILIGGRHVAAVRNGTLSRTFDGRTELLRGGLAFRVDVLMLAEQAGATRIMATERNSGQRYVVPFVTFARRGWAYHNAIYGDQVVLPLDQWGRLGAADEPAQLGLFEGVADE